jgi:hypothetical protein
MGRQSGKRVMGLLEGRTEAISGKFTPQTVSQMRFAYDTKGRKFPKKNFLFLGEGKWAKDRGEGVTLKL